jgi:hypothetical protein
MSAWVGFSRRSRGSISSSSPQPSSSESSAIGPIEPSRWQQALRREANRRSTVMPSSHVREPRPGPASQHLTASTESVDAPLKIRKIRNQKDHVNSSDGTPHKLRTVPQVSGPENRKPKFSDQWNSLLVLPPLSNKSPPRVSESALSPFRRKHKHKTGDLDSYSPLKSKPVSVPETALEMTPHPLRTSSRQSLKKKVASMLSSRQSISKSVMTKASSQLRADPSPRLSFSSIRTSLSRGSSLQSAHSQENGWATKSLPSAEM